MRFLPLLFPVLLGLAGCAGGPAYEDPLPRATYQKVNVTSYMGAGGNGLTACGSRYLVGAVSSAAADWARWPAGTQFRVLATGDIYTVDDYTDDIVGQNLLLLYKPAAPNSATRQVTIEILRWGSPSESAALLRTQKSSTAKKILSELLARYPERR
ncbi:MAG TPA: hypothetical protein VIM61_15715 [Chthoniobacterales bacterium]